MIHIYNFHYKVKSYLLRLDSNYDEDLVPMEIDNYINICINNLFTAFLENNSSDKYQKIFSYYLEHYNSEEDNLLSAIDYKLIRGLHRYSFDLSDLNSVFFKEHSLFIHSENCNIISDIDILKDNLYSITNPNIGPKLIFGRLVGSLNFTNDTNILNIFSDKLLNNPKLGITYYRRFKEAFYGGYNSLEYQQCIKNPSDQGNILCEQFNNINTPLINIDFNKNYENILLLLVVREIAKVTGNQIILSTINNSLTEVLIN